MVFPWFFLFIDFWFFYLLEFDFAVVIKVGRQQIDWNCWYSCWRWEGFSSPDSMCLITGVWLTFESSMNELLFSFFAVMFTLLIKKLIFSICFCYVHLLFGYLGRLPSEMLFLCHWKRGLFKESSEPWNCWAGLCPYIH